MKTLNLLMSVPCVLFLQNAFAQNTSYLKLSDQTPSVGEKITLTYDPSVTMLAGKPNPEAMVYFLDNKVNPAADVTLKAVGKNLQGDFVIPATAKLILVKLTSGDVIDDNDGKGYMYEVYKDKKPVPGAYAMRAYLIHSGMGNYIAKVTPDNAAALALYKKEFAMYPASETDFRGNYYMFLANPKLPENLPLLNTKLAALEKSTKEEDLTLAANLYMSSKRKAQADSINAIIKTKFPEGLQARNMLMNSFYRTADATKKDSILKVFLAKYPETDAKKPIENGFRSQLASAYLSKGDIAGYRKEAALMTDKSNLPNVLNSAAWAWAGKGERLADAEALSKESLDILQAKINNPSTEPQFLTSPAKAKKNLEQSYDMFADTYAFILYKEGKFAEAAKYQQAVYEHYKNSDAEVNEHYAMILNGAGQYAKAKEVIETSLKAGKTSPGLKAELAKAYVKVKGSDKGYTEYLTVLENELKNKVRAKFVKDMINMPAPAFALKDFDGNEVSLASLKGKVVVVDFWATWCGPCKASFPGMQMAVNKFKDDANVKFLFVDTWENGDDYLPGVKKFIADNKYTFHVLMDQKGEDGRQSKVVSQFKVDGIPTKFIIDKSGNIRFKYVGYSGTSEGVLEEVTNMVELAADPDAVVNSPKVSMNK